MDVFRELVVALLDNRISAKDFEASYIRGYTEAATLGTPIPFAADELFYGVDAFNSEPTLRAPLDIDEATLREEAGDALARWSQPWPGGAKEGA